MSVRAVLGALQAVAATALECELSREFGVAWIPRADGRGNEIRGVTQAQLDATPTPDSSGAREGARGWRGRGSASTAARQLRASYCMSPTPPRSSHVRARTRPRSTGTRSRGDGTPPSAATWPGSRPRCRTPAAPARKRASITRAGRRPDRLRARPRNGLWPRPWSWCPISTRPGPGTTCSSSSPWCCPRKPGR